VSGWISKSTICRAKHQCYNWELPCDIEGPVKVREEKISWSSCGLVHLWINWKCPHSTLISKSTQELWVHEQQTPTIVCGWGLVGSTIASWRKCALPSYEGGLTLVMLAQKTHLRYTIHNPTSEWACCNYTHT